LEQLTSTLNTPVLSSFHSDSLSKPTGAVNPVLSHLQALANTCPMFCSLLTRGDLIYTISPTRMRHQRTPEFARTPVHPIAYVATYLQHLPHKQCGQPAFIVPSAHEGVSLHNAPCGCQGQGSGKLGRRLCEHTCV